MANTTNQGWAKPTVGGSEDTWGATINTALDAIDTLVGSVTAAQIAKLDGLTSSTAELNHVTGVSGAIQTQLGTKAPLADPTFTGTATIPTATITTANITTVDLGDWTVTEASGVLKFATGGVDKMKLDASGNLTVMGDVTGYGTI
tara:strand:+ start:334 stop:771 length:438 start_codon:yes stop_codon:yes gene_type:complete